MGGLSFMLSNLFVGSMPFEITQEMMKEPQKANRINNIMQSGIELIAAERERQIKKGWDSSHDDALGKADLTFASMAYAHEGAARQGRWVNVPLTKKGEPPRQWPFSDNLWNPENNAIDNLERTPDLMRIMCHT